MKKLVITLFAVLLMPPAFSLNLKEEAQKYDLSALNNVLTQKAEDAQTKTQSVTPALWKNSYRTYAAELRAEVEKLHTLFEDKIACTEDDINNIPLTREQYKAMDEGAANISTLSILVAAADSMEEFLADEEAAKEALSLFGLGEDDFDASAITLTPEQKDELLVSQLITLIKMSKSEDALAQMLMGAFSDEGGQKDIKQLYKEESATLFATMLKLKELNNALEKAESIDANGLATLFIKAKDLF